MTTTNTNSDSVDVTVQNLGGIDLLQTTLFPGLNVLSGVNATNRTSFLYALATALGSGRATLRTGADEGHVTLNMGDATYERTLTQTGPHSASIGGDGYLSDATDAETFAWLFQDNPIRTAVRENQTQFRELLMGPVDTAAIDSEIDRLTTKRDELKADLADIEDAREQLVAIEEDITQITAEKEAAEADIAEAKERLAALQEESTGGAEVQSERSEQIDDLQSEIADSTSDLDWKETKLEQARETLETTKESKAEAEEKLTALEDQYASIDESVANVDDELSSLRAERNDLVNVRRSLNDVISFNKSLLSGDGDDSVLETFRDDSDNGVAALDAALGDAPDGLSCPVCGSDTSTDAVRERLNSLSRQRNELNDQVDEIDDKLETLRSRQDEREELQSDIEAQQRRITDLEQTISRTEDEIESLKQERETLEDTIEEKRAELEELQSAYDETILEQQDAVGEAKGRVRRLESQLEDKNETQAELESLVASEDEVEAELADIRDELSNYRDRVETIESDLVEIFNKQMKDVVAELSFENLDRVWIESHHSGDPETETTFEIHVVRSIGGTGREGTLETLSESEREVVGLLLAVSGYMAHDIVDEMPFILIDSVEMVDSARLAELIEYITSRTEYTVAALLEEDAAVLDDGAEQVIDFGEGVPTV